METVGEGCKFPWRFLFLKFQFQGHLFFVVNVFICGLGGGINFSEHLKETWHFFTSFVARFGQVWALPGLLADLTPGG